MSTRAHTATRPRALRRAEARRRVVRRRRVAAILGTALVVGLGVALSWPSFHHAVREIALPLRHEDIIRQQARDKGLDPALIAGGHLRRVALPRRPDVRAGAQGLMQITPATARMIARKSGGVAFTVEDLGTPQVNIAYGVLVSALPAAAATPATRRSRSRPTTAARATSTAGSPRARARNADLTIDGDPVLGDARVRAARARRPSASTAARTRASSGSERGRGLPVPGAPARPPRTHRPR